MAHTDSLVTYTQALQDKIKAGAIAGAFSELVDPDLVFYGDQNQIPGYPAVCIEPDAKQRQLAGGFRRSENTLQVYILVYHGEVRNHQTNRKQADELAESIESYIHQDPSLGGLVINVYVTEIASGYVAKNNTPVRACRMTVTGLTKTGL